MSAGNYTLYIEQGATFTVTFTWYDAAGVAVNLTNYTAALQLRKKLTDTDAALALTHSSGIVLGGAAGTIVVTMSAAQTTALTQEQYVWDLKLTSAAGVATRLLEGTAKVALAVTR